jgi:hypothetical protein
MQPSRPLAFFVKQLRKLDAMAFQNHSLKIINRANAYDGSLALLETTETQLAAASFLDGREEFGKVSGQIHYADWKNPEYHPVLTSGFIHHVSFCGSSFLSRDLAKKYHCTGLREPAALIDLSNEVKANHGKEGRLLSDLGDSLISSLVSSQAALDPVIVKPSSWCNNLIPLAYTASKTSKHVCVTLPLPEFLIAALRGGRPRLEFTARLGAHLSAGNAEWELMINGAINSLETPIGKTLAIAATAQYIQIAIFQSFAEKLGSERVLIVSGETLLGIDSQKMVSAIGEFLGLKARKQAVNSNDQRQHSKNPSQLFDMESQLETGRVISENYRTEIDQVLAWYKEMQTGHRGLF